MPVLLPAGLTGYLWLKGVILASRAGPAPCGHSPDPLPHLLSHPRHQRGPHRQPGRICALACLWPPAGGGPAVVDSPGDPAAQAAALPAANQSHGWIAAALLGYWALRLGLSFTGFNAFPRTWPCP